MSGSLADKVRRRITVADDGCWIWQGGKTWKGYGVVHDTEARRNRYTHRVLYEEAKGPIADGMQIDHLCRNTSCCNPDHLEAVTPKVNTVRGASPEITRQRHKSQTHCRRGHEYGDDNLYVDAKGGRSCKICRQMSHEKSDAKRRPKGAGYRTVTAQGGNVASIKEALKL